MEKVDLESRYLSNYRDARALGSGFVLVLLLVGCALYFFVEHRSSLDLESTNWEARYNAAEQAIESVNALDTDAKTWQQSYSISQQRSDQVRIGKLQELINSIGTGSLGNLSLTDGLQASERYWTMLSEHALQLALLRDEANNQLYQILEAARSAKANKTNLSLIAQLPEQHQGAVVNGEETAGAALTRSVTQLTKTAPSLATLNKDYLSSIERITTLKTGFSERLAEVQAQRFERQNDLRSMLGAIQQQAVTRIERIAESERQSSYWFYGFVGVLALFVLLRSFSVARKMRLQATKVEQDQNYMLERMQTSEANEKAKTSFLSVISYEARTALDSILGLTRLAQHSAASPDQEAKLGEVISSSQTLNNLLDDVLNFIDLELGSVVLEEEPFSPKNALALLMNKHARQAKLKNVLFESDIDPSLNQVYLGDQKRFYQALDCLLTNSVRFTEKGHVIFSLVADAGQSLSPELQRLNIRIEDTGMSLSKEEASALFDPFSAALFMSTRKSGGSGVRLSTAARLIEMMDGEVEVESSKGHGVVFNFHLHLAYADASLEPVSTTSLEETVSQAKVDLQKLKVLVVEDNLTNSSLLKWILEDLEHEVEVAENGVECLNMVESKDFDLIFMDQHMPEMDGEEATRKIRERKDHKAKIPIVGCTADAFQETRDLLLAAGQDDVIVKPISNDSVFEITQNLLAGQYKEKMATGGAEEKANKPEA